MRKRDKVAYAIIFILCFVGMVASIIGVLWGDKIKNKINNLGVNAETGVKLTATNTLNVDFYEKTKEENLVKNKLNIINSNNVMFNSNVNLECYLESETRFTREENIYNGNKRKVGKEYITVVSTSVANVYEFVREKFSSTIITNDKANIWGGGNGSVGNIVQKMEAGVTQNIAKLSILTQCEFVDGVWGVDTRHSFLFINPQEIVKKDAYKFIDIKHNLGKFVHASEKAKFIETNILNIAGENDMQVLGTRIFTPENQLVDKSTYLYINLEPILHTVTYQYMNSLGNYVQQYEKVLNNTQMVNIPNIDVITVPFAKFLGWNVAINQAVSNDLFVEAVYDFDKFNVFYYDISNFVTKTIKLTHYDNPTLFQLENIVIGDIKYVFKGWSLTKDNQEVLTSSYRATENVSLYPVFAEEVAKEEDKNEQEQENNLKIDWNLDWVKNLWNEHKQTIVIVLGVVLGLFVLSVIAVLLSKKSSRKIKKNWRHRR